MSGLRIVVNKGERRLYLYEGDRVARVYPVALGLAPDGDKEVEGDGRTPLGEFYVCAKNPEAEKPSRYLGQPTPGQGNNVNTGFGVSTMRLNLGYDRVIIAGFSLGARVGYVFNGTNEDFASFIPVHAEARAAYTFGSNPWKDQVVRPWIFLSGGFAQVDTAVEVDVLEDGEACGAADPGDNASECTIDSESGEAIDACRDLIDELKATVPIWKHQRFIDGTDEWVGTP